MLSRVIAASSTATNCRASSVTEIRAKSTRYARASSSSRSSGPSQDSSRSTGAPLLPTSACAASVKASAVSASRGIVEPEDLVRTHGHQMIFSVSTTVSSRSAKCV